MKMNVSLYKESIISLPSIQGRLTQMREIAQRCKKDIFFRYDAHMPFLKSRLHYILFLLFFLLYSLSPLRMSSDRLLKGLQENSETASIRIMLVEKFMDLLTDRLSLDGLDNTDDADVEVMFKKKRALLRSATLFLLLLITIVSHIGARYYSLRSDPGTGSGRFRHARCLEPFNTLDVYLSPHSGLAPPVLPA